MTLEMVGNKNNNHNNYYDYYFDDNVGRLRACSTLTNLRSTVSDVGSEGL